MTVATTAAQEIQVGERLVRVSSPDKPYFPERGLTKLDVISYFLSVGDGILRALRDRPTMLERWPRGVFEGAKVATRQTNKGDAFYQKRLPAGAPDWVRTAHITFPSGRTADEVAPSELAVVIWAANLGTLRFHPWPVSKDDVEHPDQLRIDLDPMPGVGFAQVVPVAHEVRAYLTELGLEGFPKTTGGRGIHVYVSIEPRWSFGECRRAVLALGREMQRRLPDLVTTTWWRDQRDRPVFVDYNQMARDHTMTSAYSIRPTPAALVSAPLEWAELDDARPEDFDVLSMPERFAELGDPHAGLDGRRYSLEPLLERADAEGLESPPER
ncbi:DNA polymerase domain-containing protein [Micromonospora aurantiaca (nom. illeg.)]|uniref:DNA polymerase domain-containing protein n=1 Tax=Micromonospora aurantiaca (nom. illeg.) TaxID=47850 RepID=UPI00082864AC|nr:DNA primase small subunit domain-containing protein [Micromonospora aurantiaca]SCL24523.1 DNA ligase D, polymerase domain-containing protein [Micromonospora aurantiaca]